MAEWIGCCWYQWIKHISNPEDTQLVLLLQFLPNALTLKVVAMPKASQPPTSVKKHQPCKHNICFALCFKFTEHYTLFFHIRHIVQKERLVQSLGIHIYLEYKTQPKLKKDTDSHTWKHLKSNCRTIILSHSTTNTTGVSSAPLCQLWKHGGRKGKRESKRSSRTMNRTKKGNRQQWHCITSPSSVPTTQPSLFAFWTHFMTQKSRTGQSSPSLLSSGIMSVPIGLLWSGTGSSTIINLLHTTCHHTPHFLRHRHLYLRVDRQEGSRVHCVHGMRSNHLTTCAAHTPHFWIQLRSSFQHGPYRVGYDMQGNISPVAWQGRTLSVMWMRWCGQMPTGDRIHSLNIFQSFPYNTMCCRTF